MHWHSSCLARHNGALVGTCRQVEWFKGSDSLHAKLEHCDGGNHCAAEQDQAIVAVSVCGGDTHNSSSYTESSVKRKRLRPLDAVSQPFARHSNSLPRSLLTLSVTLAWLQSGIMSSVGLWWVCVLIHKQINQNKVRLTATLSQSQHPHSCQQKFTSMPVESHEVAFFTKMSHKLQRATVLAMCANILPCGSIFFWQWFWKKGAVCLDACGLKAWVHRSGSLSQTSSVCLIDFPTYLGSFYRHNWITIRKTVAMCSSSITSFITFSC